MAKIPIMIEPIQTNTLPVSSMRITLPNTLPPLSIFRCQEKIDGEEWQQVEQYATVRERQLVFVYEFVVHLPPTVSC